MAPSGSRKRRRSEPDPDSSLSQSSRTLLPKRRRTDAFHRGQIVRVRVKNFTTYADGEFQCSPTLNLVIGPNGTGKLTLVAAICLGLAGRPELISRKELKHMIRAGQAKAVVEVELKNEPRNVIIRREFTANNNLKWFLNNLLVLEKDITELVKSFNIQLSNLCHFLPQERVTEFASMDSRKLLEETQRTLGDGHLLKWHQQLIEWDDELHESEEAIGRLQDKQESLEGQRDQLMAQKEAYELFQAKRAVVDLHRELIPFAQKHDLSHQLQQTKRDFENARAMLKQHEERLRPMKEILEAATSKATRLREARNPESLKSLKQAQHQLEEDVDLHRSGFTDIKNAINSKSKKAAESHKVLRNKRKEKAKYEKHLDTLPQPVDQAEVEELREKREAIRSKKVDIQMDIDTDDNKISELRRKVKTNLSRIKEIDRRLTSPDTLQKLDPEGNGGHGKNNRRFHIRAQSYAAHRRLRELKENGENVPTYWECPAVSCWAKDRSYAHFLEAAFDNNTMLAITVASNADARQIEALLGKDINVPIRVISNHRASEASRDMIKKLGFDGLLSDYLDGPKEVVQMAVSTLYLNLIPVKKSAMPPDEVTRIATNETLYSQYNVRRFMESSSQYKVNKSNYGDRELWYNAEKVWDAQYFRGNQGLTEEAIARFERKKEEINQEVLEIEAQCRELENNKLLKMEKVKELDAEFEALAEQRTEWVKRNRDHERITQRLNEINDEITELENLSPEHYHDEVRAHRKQLVEAHKALARKRLRLSDHLGNRVAALVKHKFKEFQYIDCESRSRNITAIMNQVDDIGKNLRQAYQDAKQAMLDAKSSDRAVAIESAIRKFYERPNLELRQQVEGLMNEYKSAGTFSEVIITERIQVLQEELLTLQGSSDRSAIENFQKKQAELDEIEQKLPLLEARIETNTAKIEQLLPRWKAELQHYVEQISNEFNVRFTKDVACDGLVELAEADRYRDYELQILTKFRPNLPLKVLDFQTQSGGERAVATIFFIMSLQGLTDAPFRVVDEINQGMDPTNERAAHRNLVQTASASPQSQYFLVTPKLLTDLYYSKDMAVHCIFAADSDKLAPRAEVGDFLNFRALVK